ncbi:PAS domain-containing protein [Novosphingobium lindaniclasticum]|uniref:histidine kinase n=1 Tax=Novosphingobium lindaniclasticum LE124 TaxID=1096930 RepID=T0H7A7_9SPHN|nr:PAS domain-containing protein [Novosphingobium lindaniclasticum]EQB07978.1 hypothetical protein L284_21900 [Novosphingobium lindaniclasticum LE124]
MGEQPSYQELERRLAAAQEEASAAKSALSAAEARLRQALQVGGMEYWEWDPVSDRVTRANAISTFGPSGQVAHAHKGIDGFVRVHPDDRERHQAMVLKAGQTGTGWHMEFRVVRPDTGEIEWLEERASPTTDPATGERRINGFIWNVTDRKRAEAARAEGEERLRLAIEIGELASWDWDTRSGAVTWSDRHFLMQGYRIGEVTPSFEAWLARVHPEDRAETVSRIEAARDTRQVYAHEFRTLHPDGTVLWCAARGRFFYDETGAPCRMIGVMEDITERKRSEQALNDELRDTLILQQLGARLVTEDNVQTIYEEVLSAAIAIMRAKAGSVQMLDSETEELVILAAQGFSRRTQDRFHRVSASSSTSCGLAMRTGSRAWCHFDPASSDPSVRLHVEDGVLSAQSMPLVSRSGRAIGMVSTHWATADHRPSERDLRFLDLLARQAADLLEQRAAEAVLRKSEAKYRSLFDKLEDGIAVLRAVRDPAGQIVDFIYLELNEAVQRQTGLERSHFLGRPLSEVSLKDDFDNWLPIHRQVVETGEPVTVENYAQSVQRWFELSVYPSGPDRIALFIRDIDGRKQGEIALRESREHQAFLLELSDALRAEKDADAVAYRAIGMLSDHMRLDRCYVTYYRPEDDRADFPYQIGNDTVPPLPAQVRLSDFPDAYRQLLEKTFVIEDDFARRGLSDAERASSKAVGMRAMLASTLRRGTKNPLCSMAAVSSSPRRWSAGEIALVEAAAERTWAAIERARTDEVLRESEERQMFLLSLSDAVRNLADPAEIMALTSAMVGAHMRVGRCGYGEVPPPGDMLIVRRDWTDGEMGSLQGQWRLDLFSDDIVSSYRAGRTVIIEDAHVDPIAQGNEEALRAIGGLRSSIAVPLLRDGRLTAFFYVQHTLPRRWSAGEQDLVREVAERTWSTLERARTEARLRESEERFRQFADASSGALWIRDAATLNMEFASRAIEPIYGIEADELLGDVKRWAALILPEDRDIALEHLERARSGEATLHEFRIQRASDKAFRWIRNTDFPLRDNGHIPRIGGIALDVTEEKLSAEHQTVLLAELQHRVRNIMAIIRSITLRTADGAGSVSDYSELLSGRLDTFARVQALLTRAANVGVGMATIVHDELSALAGHGGQFDAQGPEIELSPKAAETMTLAVHELTTNALKYGALSHPDGLVRVRWSVEEKPTKPWLVFEWSESGAPGREPPDRPRRVGFGSELIEGRIPYELNGRGSVRFEAGGAQCRLEFPLKDGASILETDAPQPATLFGGAIDMSGQADLTGQRVLVVEDDYYLAADTARALKGAGAQVLGPCPSEDAARAHMADAPPTCAVLDINLGGGRSFDLAGDLRRDGVPFVFITGYDQDVIPERFAGIPCLQKPVEFRHIIGALADSLGV